MAKREELINKAAKHLGISKSTLYRACDDGQVQTRTLELGTVLVDLASAERWKRKKLSQEQGRGRPIKWD